MIQLHAFEDPRAHSDALAKAVGEALQASLTAQVAATDAGAFRTTLAVSGGSSPRPFLQTLSTHAFDWSHINVTLVDDRWVPETDSASNSKLAHETLLQNAAAKARYLPLVDTSQTLEAQVAALNSDPQRVVPHVAVLGMGEDGHTASIFADAPEWDFAISTNDHFVAVHPVAAPHARISWSLSALKKVEHLFLFIAGQSKMDVLKAASATLQKNAISQLANDKGVRLDVYWCAN